MAPLAAAAPALGNFMITKTFGRNSSHKPS
jgi:hypothetical protein